MEPVSQTKTAYRTQLPFSGGLSPLTDKSRQVPLFGDTKSIEELITLEKNQRSMDDSIHGGADWDFDGDDDGHSYREKGDDFMRQEEIEEILARMDASGSQSGEQWLLTTRDHKQILFPSQQAAQDEVRQRGLKVRNLSRIPSRTAQVNQSNATGVIAETISSCAKIEATDSTGNGETGAIFCVAPGIWVTCAHCVKKYDKLGKKEQPSGITIRLTRNGETASGELMAYDSDQDMAFIASPMDAKPLVLESRTTVGENVIAIGSPLGYENNVSQGMVSSVNRQIFSYPNAPRYLFTDANVLPGNSGGPLISEKTGHVIGMMCIIVSQGGFYGLNVALPASYIQKGLAKMGHKG